MRKLLAAILLAFAALAFLWGGYWLLGARAIEGGVRTWLGQQGDAGWIAEFANVQTLGFPNRFDTTITGLTLADPGTGVTWNAPFFQILALSYRPGHIIAVWPREQQVSTPWQKIAIRSRQMRGSVVFKSGTAFVLDRSSFELSALSLVSSGGWSIEIPRGKFDTRQAATRKNAHDIVFSADGFRLSGGIRDRLDPAGPLPERIKTLKIDGTVGFDRPWDRFAIERGRPAINMIEIDRLTTHWGDMQLHAAGELAVDAAGIPEGKVAIRAKNWRRMLDIAVAAGLLSEALRPITESILGALANADDTLDAPLGFSGGRVLFAGLPLGPAPRLVLR